MFIKSGGRGVGWVRGMSISEGGVVIFLVFDCFGIFIYLLVVYFMVLVFFIIMLVGVFDFLF